MCTANIRLTHVIPDLMLQRRRGLGLARKTKQECPLVSSPGEVSNLRVLTVLIKLTSEQVNRKDFLCIKQECFSIQGNLPVHLRVLSEQ